MLSLSYALTSLIQYNYDFLNTISHYSIDQTKLSIFSIALLYSCFVFEASVDHFSVKCTTIMVAGTWPAHDKNQARLRDFYKSGINLKLLQMRQDSNKILPLCLWGENTHTVLFIFLPNLTYNDEGLFIIRFSLCVNDFIRSF